MLPADRQIGEPSVGDGVEVISAAFRTSAPTLALWHNPDFTIAAWAAHMDTRTVFPPPAYRLPRYLDLRMPFAGQVRLAA